LQPVLFGFMGKVVAAVLVLTLVATVGMETPIRHLAQSALASQEQSSPQQQRQDAFTLRQAWILITSSRQVLIFFSFLVLFTLALFLQDPILESYGAQVFGMSIASTATGPESSAGTLSCSITPK
jgi:BCD family chlorophyll transporter-like MFS transporter